MAYRFTPDQHHRIHTAVAALEGSTGAKVATIVTRVSDRYLMYTMVWATLGALIAGGVAIATRPALSGVGVMLVELFALVAFTIVVDILPIRLALVPQRVKRAEARELAHREFAILAREPHRNRILIFVSTGEHYAEIIADHQTHARAPEDGWDRVVDDLIASLRNDDVASGIVGALEACGAMLTRPEPALP